MISSPQLAHAWLRRAERAAVRIAGTFVALAALASAPPAALAQGPRGAGPDARIPAARTVRVGAGATWTRSAERYENGVLREIGDRFTFATLGSELLPSLGPIEAAARVATGVPEFRGSLGTVDTRARTRFESTPLFLEYGVTSRFALGVAVPFVTSISRVEAVVNATPGVATLGSNPASGSEAIVQANALLLSQMGAASAFVAQRIVACGAAPGGSGCAPYANAPGAALALVAESNAFANALAALYGGRNGSTGAPFIPLAGSPAQAAVAARLAGLKAQFAAFGATAIAAGAPVGAPAPMTGAEFQRVLSDSAHGILANRLVPVVRRGIGDIDLSATVVWHDSHSRASASGGWRERTWWRSAVTAVYRAPSGAPAESADLIPVPRGDGQADYEVRSITDVGAGRRISLTTHLRYTLQAATTSTVRVPASPADVLPSAAQAAAVSFDPGDEIAADFHPRWTLSEAMAVAGYYGYRRRSRDSYTSASGATDGSPVRAALDALGDAGAAGEHRFGASVAYSTVAAWERGAARWPIEVSLSHFQTTAGSGAAVPKLTHDDVTVRWYWRPFGRSEAQRR